MMQSRMRNTMSSSLPQCSLCHKNYDTYYHIPRVIPKCGHTFCEKCIVSKLQLFKSTRKTFTCPECQTDVIIRKSVADELPRNITIIDLSSNIRKTVVQHAQSSECIQQCPQHHRAIDMICLSCNHAKICSHCALFGIHKGHEITNEIVAMESDLKDLQEYVGIVNDSIDATMLPHSSQNIIKSSTEQLKMGFQKIIKISFRQYYEKIEKKQAALLQQCEQIDFNEFYTNKNIDTVLVSFDNLRIKQQNILSSCKDRHVSVTSREVEELLAKAKNIHNMVQEICEAYSQKVSAYLDRVMKKITACSFFKIQENSRAYSNVIEILLEAADSPAKESQLKHAGSREKGSREKDSRSLNQANRLKMPQSYINEQNLLDEAFPSPKHSLLPQKKAAHQNIRKLSEQLQPQKLTSITVNNLQQPRRKHENGLKQDQLSTNILHNKKLMPKGDNSKALEASVVSEKQIKISRSTQQRDEKKTKSISKLQEKKQEPPSSALIDLTYEKPTKQLNYNLQSKYQDIIKQILRQQDTDSLQLIGFEITDQLIPHICEFLRHKKLKFSMMKLVKNQIGDSGLKVLLSYLTVDKFTKVLNLTSNNMTNQSIDLLARFVELNNILKSIYLSHNKISPMQLKRKRSIFQAKFVEINI